MDDSNIYVATYFESFHPSFPLLHRQSLGNDMPKLSKQIIVSIGMSYASRNLPEGDREILGRKGQALWQAGQAELWRLVSLSTRASYMS